MATSTLSVCPATAKEPGTMPLADPTDVTTPAIRPIGVDGWLVSFGDQLTEPANRAALAFRAALDRADVPGMVETAAALTSVYARFDLAATDHEQTHRTLENLLAGRDWRAAPLPQGRRLWRVPAVFGTDLAPQLDDAARLAGMSPAEAVAGLCAAPLRVQAIGFAPGQPYLGQLPPAWDLPRQKDLTPRVPEGAVVVAIRQAIVFSVTTPTGWRHVGQTALRLFRPDHADPFLLRPGDEVLFQPAPPDALDALRRSGPDGGAMAEALP
jgi:inhibitor of KinA